MTIIMIALLLLNKKAGLDLNDDQLDQLFYLVMVYLGGQSAVDAVIAFKRIPNETQVQ